MNFSPQNFFKRVKKVYAEPEFNFRHLAESVIQHEMYRKQFYIYLMLMYRNHVLNSIYSKNEKVVTKRLVNNFTCSYCNRSFSKSYNKKIHERTHTDERPFNCQICNRKFRRKDHLKDHVLIHGKRNKLKCGHCYKSFTNNRTLQRHVKQFHK